MAEADVLAAIAALQATVDGLGTAGGAAVNTDAYGDNASAGRPGVTVGTTKIGTQAGTFANASNVNGVYHVITNTGNAIDWVYEFRCGGGTTPVGVVWTGYLTSSNDIITFSAWNHVTHGWESVGSQIGVNTTVNVVKNLILYPRHIGPVGAELGKVYIRLHCTAMSSPVLNTDQLYVSYAITSRSIGYADGSIWIDTLNGVAGSEPFVNGTADNPCLTYADAELLETALGINRFRIRNGSVLTISGLVNDLVQHTLVGNNWTLMMTNDLDISDAYIEGAIVSGTAIVPSGDADFENCVIGDLTIGSCTMNNCLLTGTLTTRANGLYTLIGCSDGLPGTGTNPAVVYAAAVGFAARYWSGGIELKSCTLGCFTAIGGLGRVVINASCTGGQIVIRGNVDLTDIGGVYGTFDALADGTLVDSARYDVAQIAEHAAVDLIADLTPVLAAIATVKAKTDLITAGNLEITSPVATDGTITIYPGDDYLAAHGRGLSVLIADPTHAMVLDAVGTVVTLKTAQTSWPATSATSTTAGYTVLIEATAAQTALLTAESQSYVIEAEFADHHVITLASGSLVAATDL